jgi:predicted TIM-barrel fold metal-dependent hydrolase
MWLPAMERRRFFARAAALTGGALLAGPSRAAETAGLIDTNVHLGPWPTRRASVAPPAQLAARLRRRGVTSAWVASFDGVLHTDVGAVNARLAESCAAEGGGAFFRPFGTVNPLFPDWEEDLRRCHEVHRMPGVRLYPNYHGYTLEQPPFSRLLEAATRRGLLVQISLSLEDDRSQNPALAAAPVNVAPLPDLLTRLPATRVMLLNATSRVLAPGNPLLTRLGRAGVLFEIATVEGVEGIARILGKLPELRLAFGSHAPYFYFESALLKLQESALPPAQLAAITHGHASAALVRS